MRVKLTIDGVVEVPTIGDFRIAIGQVFKLKVSQVRGPLRWSADNDEVLDIVDDGTDVAKITAANTGKSRLTIVPEVGPMHVLNIEVYRDEAVGFAAQVGPEVPR